MNAIIGIAGCKNSGKSSLCRYLSFIIARADGLIVDDSLSGSFDNRNLAQVPKDATKKVYITSNNSTYTEAKLLCEPNVEIMSFANPLKEICTNILNIPSDNVYGSDEDKSVNTEYTWDNMPSHIRSSNGSNKSGNMTAREVMQVIGTDIFRNYFHNNIWVSYMLRKINSSKADVIFIDDLRFNSEAEALMNKGAMIIHIERMWGQGGSHHSENGLDINILKSYKHFYKIPDVSMMSKNEIAFKAVKEYFKYVLSSQSDTVKQI